MEEIKRRRLTARERNQLFNTFNGRCAYCGTELKNMGAMKIDNKVPLTLGGADTMENMFPACLSCNRYKHTLDIGGFRRYLSGIAHRLMRENLEFNIATRYGLVKHMGDTVTFYFETAGEGKGAEGTEKETV